MVKENSNMNFSVQGLNNYLSSEITKDFWLNEIYPEHIRNAHINGDFHIHDLGLLAVYCVGWDLQDLLLTGFKGVSGKVASKPAKHFRTALLQIVNFFFTLQGEAAGAQAFSNVDTLLAPFIYYDNLSYNEVKQAMQEFVFNLNVPTRVGFQCPFTNFSFDLKCPKHLSEQSVVVGGIYKEEAYGQFQKEMNMFNQAFLEIMCEGDAEGRVFTFPIPTYSITKDFEWDNPVYEKLWETTAKYGIPYFSNFINSDMSPEQVRSMCCRLRIDNTQLRKRGGGLFGANPLTGSVGVVTINLPRIGYLSKDTNDFIEKLKYLMDIAYESLNIKRKILEELTEKGLYPYACFYLRDVNNRFGEYWKNHFSTIGLIGMNEACLNFLGKGLETETGQCFAKKIMDFMREKLLEYQEKTGDVWNLEATPAEGTTYRLAKMDSEKFPDIITANKKGKEPFYTNSTHLPVDYTNSLFSTLEFQDELQCKYTGGTVLHAFLGQRIPSQNVPHLIRSVFEKYKLPYFTLTPTFSICINCGYLDGEHWACPHCQGKTEVYSRVTGYLTPVERWNKGKESEFKHRKTYDI